MAESNAILAGDIGGTKTVIALFEATGDDELQPIREASYASAEYDSLESALREFLSESPEAASELRAACFGVAGAVQEGAVDVTNLPWRFSEAGLARATGAGRVRLLNDLQAMAHGMLFLQESDLEILNPGTPPFGRGNIAVIAAGTGLGEAMLYWDGELHHPVATEAGHGGFSPQTEEQIGLLRHLRGRIGGHVAYENVLSGPGLYEIYRYLRSQSEAPEPDWLTQRIEQGDPSSVVSAAALGGEDPVCSQTLELFASIYGAECGNMALRFLAVGGVFVGGGIAPKILPALRDGSFMQTFCDKGYHAPLLEKIRVAVALEPRAALLGAAHYALRL
jgi:glucokinase